MSVICYVHLCGKVMVFNPAVYVHDSGAENIISSWQITCFKLLFDSHLSEDLSGLKKKRKKRERWQFTGEFEGSQSC